MDPIDPVEPIEGALGALREFLYDNEKVRGELGIEVLLERLRPFYPRVAEALPAGVEHRAADLLRETTYSYGEKRRRAIAAFVEWLDETEGRTDPLDIPVANVKLDARDIAVLHAAGVRTLRDLTRLDAGSDALASLGVGGRDRLRGALARHGLNMRCSRGM